MDDTPPTTPTYHHGNLRAALIEAGLAALERSGSAELSLRALAREVKVSANAAYRHFADKDSLLTALAAEGFRRFSADMAAHRATPLAAGATPGGEALERFRDSGRAYVRFALTHPALFRLMFGRFAADHGEQAELKQAALTALQDLLESAAASTGASVSDPRAILQAIASWALVHGLSCLVLDRQLEPFGGDPQAWVDSVLELPLPIAPDPAGR